MEESLEVLTQEGKPTGKLKLRSEVHKSGDWHKTVQIWVMNDNNDILLQKRHPKKEGSPSKWDVSCGGHCVEHETSIESAIREMEEELGLKLEKDKFKYLGTDKYTSQQGLNNEFIDIYMVNLNFKPEELNFQKEEIEELKSVSYKELKNLYNEGDISLAKRDAAYSRLFIAVER